jgi:iron complex outermembrane receptor protein
MKFLSKLLSIGAPFLCASSLLAQSQPKPDTIKVYRLGEVVIADETIHRVTPTTVQQISLAKIDATDAVTAAGIVHQIPAARIQTNSRGESLIYVRGAGERQVALFLDGALLNVPWDNRIDLNLIPLNAIGGITVAKGVPSVLYGANVVGGAVSLVSQELREPGSLTEVVGQFGTGSLVNGTVTHIGNIGGFNYIGALGYMSRDGIALPDTAKLFSNPNIPEFLHQSDPKLRTNTDSRIANVYLRGEYRVAPGANLGVAFHMADAEKGVAPEAHTDGPRFWRYGDWRNMGAIANGNFTFGKDKDWDVRGALWWTNFEQGIDSYTSSEYNLQEARQEDHDVTLGTRFIVQKKLGAGTISLALNGLQSTHDQRDLTYDSTGVPAPYVDDATGQEGPYPTFTYQQQIYSIGAEIEQSLLPNLTFTFGASYDGMETPRTGDKPRGEGFSDYGLTSGIGYKPTEELTLRLSTGRKTRFPTMRELYGEALRRFLINPDLKPEEATLIDLGIEGRYDWGGFSVTGFSNRTTNTIDQRTIDTLPRRPRQRINLPGSRALGVEVTGELREFRPFRLEGHFTYLHARVVPEDENAPDSTLFLSEKPEMLATVIAGYDFPFGLQPSIELLHRGQAYTLNDDNVFVPLGASTTFNARLAYRLPFQWTTNFSTQIFLRVNNITNEVIMPQLGLPDAGREIQGGIKATF